MKTITDKLSTHKYFMHSIPGHTEFSKLWNSIDYKSTILLPSQTVTNEADPDKLSSELESQYRRVVNSTLEEHWGNIICLLSNSNYPAGERESDFAQLRNHLSEIGIFHRMLAIVNGRQSLRMKIPRFDEVKDEYAAICGFGIAMAYAIKDEFTAAHHSLESVNDYLRVKLETYKRNGLPSGSVVKSLKEYVKDLSKNRSNQIDLLYKGEDGSYELTLHTAIENEDYKYARAIDNKREVSIDTILDNFLDTHSDDPLERTTQAQVYLAAKLIASHLATESDTIDPKKINADGKTGVSMQIGYDSFSIYTNLKNDNELTIDTITEDAALKAKNILHSPHYTFFFPRFNFKVLYSN